MLALQALCLFDALGSDFARQLEEFLRDPLVQHDLGITPAPTVDALRFAAELAAGAWRARERYDELLGRNVADWRVNRMPPVDRNILRLGLHELLEHPETPHQVVLNEAINLARLFGGADSPAFVNGVLDGIRREVVAPDDAVDDAQRPQEDHDGIV